jgi:hypothetical protein
MFPQNFVALSLRVTEIFDFEFYPPKISVLDISKTMGAKRPRFGEVI